ncbi:tRNA-dihydrouridine synthase [Arthrobacter antioxidans]|uniref:tRNA-dihydrouridine synthase n=1 Tax=Arthrobacter antioxidans TaxID=2895818 RepID=UPI001FFE353D|nr:tRNA-dihydrouridine synthase [Arthrobacter antioxidans]
MTSTQSSTSGISNHTRRTGSLALGVTALLASALLTGCTPSGDVIDEDYAQVCQDRTTQERVEDSKCSEEGRSSSHFGWYFLPMVLNSSGSSTVIPRVGGKVSGGTTSIPSGTTARNGFAGDGQSVTRGGFGSSVKSGGNGGRSGSMGG